MYLSRIVLNETMGQHSQLGQILRDRSYSMHRLLWDLFDDRDRFLFREEISNEQLGYGSASPLYYVLSDSKPIDNSPIFDVHSKRYNPQLKEGDRLAFKLRANPTITRRNTEGKNSKRHDVVMDAQFQYLKNQCTQRDISSQGSKRELFQVLNQHTDYSAKGVVKDLTAELQKEADSAGKLWLMKRAGTNGFSIEEPTLRTSGYRWNALPEKGRSAGFSCLDYEGVLTVCDSDLIIGAIAKGIGPAKAFGCGLMMIRRIAPA